MPTPDGFRVTQNQPGNGPIDLTTREMSATWTSSIPGGFGSANIVIPRVLSQKERGLLGPITIEYEGRVLFDGRIEDDSLTWQKTSLGTELQAFGYQRLLTDNSTRRAWSIRRSLAPNTASGAKGSSTGGALLLNQNSMLYTYGSIVTLFPNSWPSGYFSSLQSPIFYGFRIQPVAAMAANDAGQVVIALPAGITGARVMFDVLQVGGVANWSLVVHSTADGVTYTKHLEQATGTVFSRVDLALVDGAREIRIAAVAVGGVVAADPTGAVTALDVANLRVIGTSLREDSAGGFYGGTILRDVVAQCPGLYPGNIEDGSDFVISEINRVDRSSCLDVVNQIAPLYAREWGVWEAGRFDWITPDLKSGGWVVPLSMTIAGKIERSVDGIAKRVYVAYIDAADGLHKEASADSNTIRNPYVRLGVNGDTVVPGPSGLTSVTAPQLAAKLVNDLGRWPDIKGEITLLAGAMIKSATGSQQVPAFAIRAGDNVTIPDLPVEDIYAAGQDGQTVFHVTGVQSGTDGNVVLTLEGLTRRIDVLMARLGVTQ